MISGDVRQFHRQLGVIPTHKDLFGREATLPDLLDCLKKYPVTEWLSFLARMQNMLAADQLGEVERMQRVLCGTVSPEIHEKLKEFEQRLAGRAKPAVVHQLSFSAWQRAISPAGPTGRGCRITSPSRVGVYSMSVGYATGYGVLLIPGTRMRSHTLYQS